MGLRERLKRLDDRVVGSTDRPRAAGNPPYWYRLGLSGSVIFGGGLLLRVLRPDALPTPPLFTAVYVALTKAFLVFAHGGSYTVRCAG